MKKKKCRRCGLINFAEAEVCLRCKCVFGTGDFEPPGDAASLLGSKLFQRAAGVAVVTLLALAAFYLSLVASARPLEYEEKKTVERAVAVLQSKGFEREAFVLENLTVYRGSDNWLNASTRLENAYAATNFPFEIVTFYGEFFQFPADDVERAAIVLHEARHLFGEDEKEAYQYVWKNRRRLGWTKEKYGGSNVWQHVRKKTREIAPELFVCSVNEFDDCTE